MPSYASNKMPSSVKKRYCELNRQGMKGAAAARVVGASTSCGSLWFLDAGGMLIKDSRSVSSRFLDQDDRIAIADALTAGLDKKTIAERIGKSFQTVYREVERNSKRDGTYQPWWAHNQALLRRKRPKQAKVAAQPKLARLARRKTQRKWSPQQIARFLRRTYPGQPFMQVCAETIDRALFAGLLGHKAGKLRTGRSRRKRHRRGTDVPNKIKNMKLLGQRPAEVAERVKPGHWEGAGSTRTRTACCASTSRRAPISPCTPPVIYAGSPANSTAAPRLCLGDRAPADVMQEFIDNLISPFATIG
jgi:IS30 family transposase